MTPKPRGAVFVCASNAAYFYVYMRVSVRRASCRQSMQLSVSCEQLHTIDDCVPRVFAFLSESSKYFLLFYPALARGWRGLCA